MFSKEELELMLDAIKMIEANTTVKFITYKSRVSLSIELIKDGLERELSERSRDRSRTIRPTVENETIS